MDVPRVGVPTGTEFLGAVQALAGPKGRSLAALEGVAPVGVAITEILRELSEPAVARLLEIVESQPSPQNAPRLEGLLRGAVSAAAEGNVPEALGKLAEYAVLDPRRAESLELEPDLVSIRQEVRSLLFRLTSAAHLDAESRLAHATRLLETAGSNEHLRQEFRPEIVILIADRLMQDGGYANSIRSAELSRMLISQYSGAPTVGAVSGVRTKRVPIRSRHVSPDLRNRWIPRIKKLWARAPLLVLLLAWAGAGLLGGLVYAFLRNYSPQTWPESVVAGSFEMWGVGFLALIAFGFYARVRNLRW